MTFGYADDIRALCLPGEYERFTSMVPALFVSADWHEDDSDWLLDIGASALVATAREMWGPLHPLGRLEAPSLGVPRRQALIVKVWRVTTDLPHDQWEALVATVNRIRQSWTEAEPL